MKTLKKTCVKDNILRIVFSVLILFLLCETSFAEWRKIRSDVKNVILGYDQIDYITNVFIVDKVNHNIFKYDGFNSWRKIGGPGYQFVAGMGITGTDIYGLTPDNSAVMHYQRKLGWKKVGGGAKKLFGGIGGLYAISPANDYVYSYDPTNSQWTKVGGPSRMLAVGGKGELYAISPDGSGIYRYLGLPGKWQRIWNYANAIFAAPGYIYATDSKGDIYKYEGQPFSWTKIGGPGKMFAATSNGDLYGLSTDGNGIYQYLGKPGKWEKIGEKAESIYAQKDNLYSLHQDTSIWTYKRQTQASNANLIILTNDELLSNAVKDYSSYKQLHGLSVAVITLDKVFRTTNGADAAEKIRNFLIKSYEGGLLQYVMLVGDVDTIPTKVFFRDNGHVENNRARLNAYTTDFYYANLHTKDWDLDKDDLWGEIKDDKLDIYHDVVVSRIPFNDAETVKQVMQQMIGFHKKKGEQWQRRVILAHGYLSENDDLAGYADKIDKNILIPNGFSSKKLYVNKGKTQSSYFDPKKVTALDDSSYMTSLKPEGQGLALLAAHGMTNGMSSIYVKSDGNRDSIGFGLWNSVINQRLSGIFLLNACNTAPMLTPNGYSTPETLDTELHKQGSLWSSVNKPVHRNIAKEYLRSGAVSVIASTVGSDSGSQVLEYELARQLIEEGQTIGNAFIRAKEKAGSARAYQSFYLVGDPTIRLK